MNVEERSTDSQPLNPSPGQTTDTPQNTGSPASQDGLSAGMEGAAQDATTLPGQNAASIQAAGAVEPGTSVTQPTDGVQEAPPVRRRRLRPHLRPVHIHVRVHTFDSFHFRNYRLLWASTVSSSGGFWLQQVIIGWLTYSLTQSALLTSLALSLDWLLTLAAPLGGLLADRWDRGKLLVLSFAYQAAITLGLSLVVLLDLLETWHIFGFIMLMGLSWVLNDPARTSLIPNIVPRKNLVNAFALNSLGFSATRLAVPAAGGILLAVVGAGPALLLQAAMQLVAVVMALGLRVAPSSRPKPQLASGPSALLEAIRYIKGDPTLLSFLLIGTIPWVVVSPFRRSTDAGLRS